jgi:hypothetical protein
MVVANLCAWVGPVEHPVWGNIFFLLFFVIIYVVIWFSIHLYWKIWVKKANAKLG